MKYNEIIKKISPCGLDCSRCTDYIEGEIKELSSNLIKLLGNYERVAKLKAAFNPIFEGYGQFREILGVFSNGTCGGCRTDNVKCPITCGLKTCCKEKKIDFCFQCPEFPCEQKSSIGWVDRNKRMKEIGVEKFYEEKVKLPRY